MNLLIVDDIEVNRALLRAQLEQLGHDIYEADNGATALTKLRELDVDGIISDILMPVMDGFRLCLEVRKDKKLGALPYVLYTSTYDSPGDRSLANNVGADAYIIKPAPMQSILDAIVAAQGKYHSDRIISATLDDDTHVLRQYNEALVRKLEERNDELIRVNAELAESESRFRNLLENIKLVSIMLDREARITYVNDYLLQLTGWRKDEIIGHNWFNIFVPDDTKRLKEVFSGLMTNDPETWHHTNEIITRSGESRLVQWNNTALRSISGQIIGTASIGEDITERKKAEQVAASLFKRNSKLVAALGEIVYDHDVAGDSLDWDGNITGTLGYSPAELGNSVDEWTALIHPDDLDAVLHQLDKTTDDNIFDVEYRIRHKAGHYIWFWDRGVTERNQAGSVVRVTGIMRNVTGHKKAEQARLESEQRFRQVAENIREVFWLTDPGKNEVLYVSPAYESTWGRPVSSLYENPGNWLEAIHEEDRDRIIRALPDQAAGTYDEKYRIVRPDGSIRWIRDQAYPVKNSKGEIYRIAGVADDITALLNIEEQLRQSQKMEAIGQLTGGIAHDFNNRLTVILGTLQLLQHGAQNDPDTAALIKSAVSAVTGAAELTGKLLTFSRQDVLRTSVISVNELINDMQDMLQRTLGETIRVVFAPGDGLLDINTDRSMLENVLLNLAVNARDAMPEGGQLIMETCNVSLDENDINSLAEMQPGDYLRIVVSDTGTGMSKAIRDRIFEPFFTTKETGKGTGLGLSMVYGFIKHSGGFIEIDSAEGRGTTFTIYLPRNISAAQTSIIVTGSKKIDTSRIRGKTILLVEDDDAVRETAVAMLDFMGIKIITANNGPAALEIFAQHPEIDLLFTDVVMPGGMTGMELAENLRKKQPGLCVLFTSGYAPQAAGDQKAFKAPGDHWLGKPYQLDDLRHAIFNVLTS